MADPGIQGRPDDDGRDLHAALGGLLTDEPAAPWAVQDDVRRGQELRTRRRTRTLGAVGIAAAIVLLAGVLGPLRPWSTSVAPGSSTPGLDEAAVSSLLEGFGWEVRDVADVRTEPDPTVTKWSVAKSDGNVTASLTIRAWMSRGSSSPSGSALEACTRDDSCELISASIADCVGSPCWSSRSTSITKGDDVTPAGTAVLLAYDDVAGVAVELVATPVACATCSQPGGTPPAFLSAAELQRVLGLVQAQLQPVPTSAPVGGVAFVPDADWTGAVASASPLLVDKVTVEEPFNAAQNVGKVAYRVVVDGKPGTVLAQVVVGQGVAASLPALCAVNDCDVVQGWTRTDAGGTTTYSSATKRVVDVTTGVQMAEALVVRGQTTMQVRSVSTDPDVGFDGSNALPLTAEETLAFALALPLPESGRTAVSTAPTEVGPPVDPLPVDGATCTSDDVKLIPASDPGERTDGLSRLLVTVHPRNPEVDCVVTGHPTVVGLDRDGAELLYTQVDVGRPQAVRVGGQQIAVFRVATSICAPVGGDLAALRVTLPGGGEPADVSVAMFAAVVSCAEAGSPDMSVGAFESAVEATPADLLPVAPGVGGFFDGLGITARGGPDYAGGGPVGDGGEYSGEYALAKGDRRATVTLTLEVGGGSAVTDAVACQEDCAAYRTTESGTDSGGGAYGPETEVVTRGSSGRFGPSGTVVLERVYADLLMRVVVSPWQGSERRLLTPEQMTFLADAVAVDARAAVRLPAGSSSASG